MTSTSEQHDFQQHPAIDFLLDWPTQRMHLWAKAPDGKIEARTFDRTDQGYNDAETWIQARDGRMNLYFVVNDISVALGKTQRDGKTILTPLETDVTRMVATQVDTDPRVNLDAKTPEAMAEHYAVEKARLLAVYERHEPRFNAIIFSGGGFQGFHMFKEPVAIDGDPEKIAEWKRANIHLKRTLFGKDSDDCESLQHVMRLPGTMNLPDAKKAARGRMPVRSELVRFDIDDRHDAAAMPKAAVPAAEPERRQEQKGFQAKSKYDRVGAEEPRLKALGAKWLKLGREGDTEGKYLKPDGSPDRSRAAIAFATACMRSGVEEDLIAAILMDPSWAIGECVRDKGGATMRVLKRTISRAREFTESDKLGEMNEQHHVVRHGGKTLVLTWDLEDELYPGRPIATYSSLEAFCQYHNKWAVQVRNEKGKIQEIPLGSWWCSNGFRRQYSGLVYAPHVNEDTVGDKLNLWRGFSVAPRDGDCSLYLEHLVNNVCVDGAGKPHKPSFEYLLGWMAYAVQHPDRQGQVAWVMLGLKGIGKTVAAEEFGKLFDAHYTAITNPDHLTGKFNAHLQSCSVLLADECFFAGDTRHEQILKTLITGDRIFIEPKGVNAYAVKNYLHIIMCTNNKWAVPASHDERRYFVLNVGAAHKDDIRYFKALCDQMDNGGRAALLRMLLSLNLEEHIVDGEPFEIRRPPKTDALRDQQHRSRRGVDALVEDMLLTGHVLFSHYKKPHVCITNGKEEGNGFDHYIESQASLDLRQQGALRVKATLRNEWGCKHYRSRLDGRNGPTTFGLEFPPLQEMRAMFEKRHGKILWPGSKDQEWEGSDDGVPF